ncbi:MAG: hypothetical protein U0938_07350, partial [Thiobacillus sp.]|nr:hypothetical protein [Thiobacillus sp.]
PHFHRDARATTQTNDAFNMELPSEPHERERLVHKMLLNQLTARPSLLPSFPLGGQWLLDMITTRLPPMSGALAAPSDLRTDASTRIYYTDCG